MKICSTPSQVEKIPLKNWGKKSQKKLKTKIHLSEMFFTDHIKDLASRKCSYIVDLM